MPLDPKRQTLGLTAFQLADALFNAIPNQWLTDDLDRLRFPERFRFVLPIIKGASALGLLGGLRWPRLGRLTVTALVVYFVLAIGAHARVRDRPLKYAPAVAMLAWSAAARRAYPVERRPA